MEAEQTEETLRGDAACGEGNTHGGDLVVGLQDEPLRVDGGLTGCLRLRLALCESSEWGRGRGRGREACAACAVLAAKDAPVALFYTLVKLHHVQLAPTVLPVLIAVLQGKSGHTSHSGATRATRETKPKPDAGCWRGWAHLIECRYVSARG